MFKKIFVAVLLITSLSLAATIVSTTLPLDAEKKVVSGELKKGESSYGSFLGLITWGDASIKAAAANGGITNILYVDQREASLNFLGAFSKYTTIVYGY
jgi:hypothetical protein